MAQSDFGRTFCNLERDSPTNNASHGRREVSRHMHGRKYKALQPHEPAEVQHLAPRLQLFVQLDTWQLPPPPDDAPEELPELEPELEPEESPELELWEHVPKLQTSPLIVQSTQVAAAIPHNVSTPLVWHLPAESQHPAQVCVQSGAASSEACPASLSGMPVPLAAPLLPPPALPPPLPPLLGLVPVLAVPLPALSEVVLPEVPSEPNGSAPSRFTVGPSPTPAAAHANNVAPAASQRVPLAARRQRNCILSLYRGPRALQDIPGPPNGPRRARDPLRRTEWPTIQRDSSHTTTCVCALIEPWDRP